MKHTTALMIMAKQPVVGSTKTRLVPFLSASEAAQLYEALLLDTIDLVGRLADMADLVIAISPPEANAYVQTIVPPGTQILPVTGKDIGECLEKGLRGLLEQGYRKALAFNSDGPSLPPEALVQSIENLDHADVTIGPSTDGGYYIIGIKEPQPALFEGVTWSTDQVLTQTLERIEALNLKVIQTQPWYDIDTAQDLLTLQEHLLTGQAKGLVHTQAFLKRTSLQNRRF